MRCTTERSPLDEKGWMPVLKDFPLSVYCLLHSPPAPSGMCRSSPAPVITTNIHVNRMVMFKGEL